MLYHILRVLTTPKKDIIELPPLQTWPWYWHDRDPVSPQVWRWCCSCTCQIHPGILENSIFTRRRQLLWIVYIFWVKYEREETCLWWIRCRFFLQILTILMSDESSEWKGFWYFRDIEKENCFGGINKKKVIWNGRKNFKTFLF